MYAQRIHRPTRSMRTSTLWHSISIPTRTHATNSYIFLSTIFLFLPVFAFLRQIGSTLNAHPNSMSAVKPNSQKRRCEKMRLNIQPPWFFTKWTAVGPNPSTRRASRWDCVSDGLSIVLVVLLEGGKRYKGRSKGWRRGVCCVSSMPTLRPACKGGKH